MFLNQRYLKADQVKKKVENEAEIRDSKQFQIYTLILCPGSSKTNPADKK